LPEGDDGMKVRACRPADWPGVLALLRQLWPGTPLDEAACRRTFRRGLRSRTQVYLCAVANGKVVGFGTLSFERTFWQAGKTEAEIDEMVVDESYRERGIGAQLLARLLAVARRRGCRAVELKSAGHRADAHRFYQRHGFALLPTRFFARKP
jgi:GNAT superfamily N-acetyltransferase